MTDKDTALASADDFSIIPAVPRCSFQIERAAKVPVADLAAMGSALAEPIGALFANGEHLFRVTDAAGRALSGADLFKFHDGTGNFAAFKNAKGILENARLHEVGGLERAVLGINPTTVFIAAALMEINHKLDDIQEVQQEILDYLKIQEHSRLIAGFERLDEIRKTYRVSSGNDDWRDNGRNDIRLIRNDARRLMTQYNGILEKKLGELDELNIVVDEAKIKEVAGTLKDYQMACYLYSYSTLEDVLMVGNYDPDYLGDIADGMRSYEQKYANLFDKCLDAVQKHADSAIVNQAVEALGSVVVGIGSLIKATPVGDATPIDEALIGAGKELGEAGLRSAMSATASIAFGRPTFMEPFIESINNLSRLYNEPVVLAMDNESMYVLSADDIVIEDDEESEPDNLQGEQGNSEAGA